MGFVGSVKQLAAEPESRVNSAKHKPYRGRVDVLVVGDVLLTVVVHRHDHAARCQTGRKYRD